MSAGIFERIGLEVAQRQAQSVQYLQNEIIVSAQRRADTASYLGALEGLSRLNFASARNREDARSVVARQSLHVAERMVQIDAAQRQIAINRARSNLTWEQVRNTVPSKDAILGQTLTEIAYNAPDQLQALFNATVIDTAQFAIDLSPNNYALKASGVNTTLPRFEVSYENAVAATVIATFLDLGARRRLYQRPGIGPGSHLSQSAMRVRLL